MVNLIQKWLLGRLYGDCMEAVWRQCGEWYFGVFSNRLLSALNSIVISIFYTPIRLWISLYLWWPSGLLHWWIFVVLEVALNLAFLSIFSGLAALMSAGIKWNLWSLVCSCLNSYCTFHLLPFLIFCFKSVAFCTEFNLLTPLFIALYNNGSPSICDGQICDVTLLETFFLYGWPNTVC